MKLHARTLPRKNVQMPVHEDFVHHFRLPRRGRGNGTFLRVYLKTGEMTGSEGFLS